MTLVSTVHYWPGISLHVTDSPLETISPPIVYYYRAAHMMEESLRKSKIATFKLLKDQNTKPIHSFNFFHVILSLSKQKWNEAKILDNMTLTILWWALIYYPQVWNPFLSHKLILSSSSLPSILFWILKWHNVHWPVTILSSSQNTRDYSHWIWNIKIEQFHVPFTWQGQ